MTESSHSRLREFLEDLTWSKVPLFLLRTSREFQEISSYPFKVRFSPFLTRSGYWEWRKSLQMAAKAVRRHKIPVRSIDIHHHWLNPSCDLGVADDGSKTISLCDNHPETALHELAHLWTQDRHTKAWARRLFQLHREYLSDQEVGFFQRETVRRYNTARELVESGEILKRCICGRRTK